jgi:hypothetical protein
LKGRAIATGMALAATVGLGYTACALAFRMWPDAAVTFMNALFHGLDFRKLQAGPARFDFGGFFFALAVFVLWAFVLGFGWMVDRFRPLGR